MIYLFHGDDDLTRNEYLNNLLARADDTMGSLNQTRLEPDKLTFAELRHACDAIPFLSERRIIIVEGLLNKLAKQASKDFAQQLKDYIPTMPEYTRLFLLETSVDKRTSLWKSLNQFASEKLPRVFIKEFALPKEHELPTWIQQRARLHGGLIERQAATDLASFVGQDVRLLDQEVRKLVTYAGEHPVTRKDVRLLVPYVQEASVWQLVDAIGSKDTRRALAAAQQILSEDPSKAIYLHIMITRQIRMLLQVAELLSLGKTQRDIQKILGLSNFVLNKVMKQASNFTIERLEAAFDHLLEADVAMKRGADQQMILNLLIVELAGRRAA
ncbi:MAG: DNA polymerase III subunit delta [Chloroflexota bacterium]|nr:DNA polymerase III subunit delta [Chloroflexota bacterium]